MVVTDILLRLPAAIAECELHGQGSSKTKPNWMNKSNSKHGIGRCNSQRNRAAVLFINWLAMRAVAQLTYSGTAHATLNDPVIKISGRSRICRHRAITDQVMPTNKAKGRPKTMKHTRVAATR